MTNSFHILSEDVFSVYRKGLLYGSMNEKVKLISDQGNVCIVEKENGDRFPVKKDLLSSVVQDPPPVKPSAPIETISKPIPKKKKSSGENQKDLFG